MLCYGCFRAPPPHELLQGIILFPSYYRIRLLFPRKLTLVWNIFAKILSYSQSSDGKSISRVHFPKETGFCRGHTLQEQYPNEFSSQPFSEWFQVLIHSNLSLFCLHIFTDCGHFVFFLKLHLLVIILSTGIKIWLCTKTDRNALLTNWIYNYWGSNIGAVFNHALVWISILAQFYYKSQLYKHIISILSILPLGAST